MPQLKKSIALNQRILRLMRRHRADYAVSPQSAALSHLNDPENDGMRISQSPISSNNVHFAISAKSVRITIYLTKPLALV